MRWLTFIIAAGLILTVQSALAPRMELAGCRPDWILVAVVFVALRFDRMDVPIVAWMLGFGADLLSIERPGLQALSYTLAAVGIASVREHVFRETIKTQLAVTIVACVVLRTAWLVYRHFMYDRTGYVLYDTAIDVILGSAYTACWAPPIHRAVSSTARLSRGANSYFAHVDFNGEHDR